MKDFYEDSLGLKDGWFVESVERNNDSHKITVKVAYSSEANYKCPACRRATVLYGTRERKVIRHLDTCECKTFIIVKYPRVKCPLCGIKPIVPPFVDGNSRYTIMFETRIIQLGNSSSNQKVAKDMGLHWNVVAGIKDRATERGKKRREEAGVKVRNLSVDETSFRKHHVYSTIISDADRGNVIAAIPGRDAEALINWFTTQKVVDLRELRSISMDMAPPYILAVKTVFPNADKLISFDRFHVASLFNRAVDNVRRKEAAAYPKEENPFYKTRFEWLRNNGKTDNRSAKRRRFLELIKRPFETVKAWRLKEQAAKLWGFRREGSALRAWRKLIWRLAHSRNAELKKLGETVKRHLGGILNAILLRASNAMAEARNSCIQQVKRAAYGFRNWERFNKEILFQYGRLNMAF